MNIHDRLNAFLDRTNRLGQVATVIGLIVSAGAVAAGLLRAFKQEPTGWLLTFGAGVGALLSLVLLATALTRNPSVVLVERSYRSKIVSDPDVNGGIRYELKTTAHVSNNGDKDLSFVYCKIPALSLEGTTRLYLREEGVSDPTSILPPHAVAWVDCRITVPSELALGWGRGVNLTVQLIDKFNHVHSLRNVAFTI